MPDTWSGSSSTAWFTSSNWSGNTPVISATGTQSVVISGGGNQPVIPYTQTKITVVQTVTTGGANYTSLAETQIGGELITLQAGADLTIQGIAMGIFYGNTDTITATGGTITGLHGALSTTPSYDSHMVISTSGTDTLTVDTINENFGLIEAVGAGNTLTIANAIGGNAQQLHGLINYGLISVGSGADITINEVAANGTTVANFYNAGWIVDDGGTLDITSSLLDGANAAGTSGAVDGYVEIGQSGDVILAGTVAAQEEVTFTDTTANTLQITAGTLFSGTVNNFGPSDTIVVNGFTSTSNATLTTVGGVVELITENGTVGTTITLTGTTSTNFTTGTNASGGEYIIAGAPTATSGTISVTGTGTELTTNGSVSGVNTFFIDNGATLSLENAATNDAGDKVIFGTHGSAASPNTLILNNNAAGFGGGITGFGANDVIDLGSTVLATLPAGDGIALSYNTTSGVLTVSETNASGGVVHTTNVTVAGASSLTTASFVASTSAAGVNIELATASESFVFNGASSSSFENGANFVGAFAPGNTLGSGVNVTIAANTASIATGALVDNGNITVNSGAGFIDTAAATGTGTLSVLAGADATLAGGTTLGAILDSGTIAVTGASALSSINMEGNGANSVVDFTGTSDATPLTNFGTTDDIILGSGVLATLPAGDGIELTYAGGVLTVAETNSSGAVVHSTNVTVAGASSLSTASFVALEASGGIEVELASNLSGQGFTFAGGGSTTSFENAANYKAGVAPGDVIASGEVVTIAAGTASVSSVSLVDNGTIAVGTTFTDAGTITGTGTLSVGTGGQATLTGTTNLGLIVDSGTLTLGGSMLAPISLTSTGRIVDSGTFSDSGAFTGSGTLTIAAGDRATLTGGGTLGLISDTGTLVLDGNFAAPISLTATGSQLTIASGIFSDTSAIVGRSGGTARGTLTVGAGATATLAGGSTVASLLDFGTIDLTGSTALSTINMEGNGANSVVDFTGSNTGTPLTSFGTSDDIIIGTSALAVVTGDAGVSLSYTGGVLTVTETNASGTSLASAKITVSGTATTGSGTLTTASFEALYGTNGVNIELASSAPANFTFTGAGGNTSFENPANFAAGLAPGNSITSAGTVTIASGTASVAVGAVVDNGTIIDNSTFIDTAAMTGTGTLNVGTGGTATLAGGTTLGAILDHGTVALTGSTGVSSINMEGNGANSVVDFTGTSDATALTNFGTSDDIILGSGVLATLPAGDGIALSYNTASGVLTVSETNASGGVVHTTNVTVAGASSLTTASFVASTSAAGVNIELDLPLESFTFTGAGSNTSFENGANFAGGFAPGNSLASGESVTIAANTASIASGALTDNGAITVNSGAGFIDTGAVAGTGTLSVLSGGSASLTGGGSLGAIRDAGSLTLGGAFTAPVSVTGALAVSGSFSDADAITGSGTLNVGTGTSATLAGGTTLGAILDHGTVALTGSTGVSSINMEGNGANSVVDFTGTSDATALTNFGTSDDIILGSGVLATLPAGDGIALSYNTASGVLTVSETNASGGVVHTTNVTVAGASSLTTASFVASTSAAGVNIELDLPLESFTFTGAGSNTSFENGANFAGGFAPGNSLASGESVTIAANTASIASGALTDNGAITVNSGAGFIDTGAVAGTGTLSVLSGGSASLTGGGSLGAIRDAGSLTLGGAFTAPVSVTGALAVSGSFSDADAITGSGTLNVGTGTSATLAGGTTLGAILDHGTVALTGSTGVSSINMEGNGANSVVDFTGTSDATALTNFGTSDDIILGSGVLATLPAGDGIALSYNTASGVLTVSETNASGGVVHTTNVTVAGASSLTTASFVASTSAAGVNIELDPPLESFTFTGAGSNTSFENGANFVGGYAPGDTLVSGETVSIVSGTAAVTGAALVDGGAISVTGTGTALQVGVPVTGTGSIFIDSGATVTLSAAGATDSGLTVTFGTQGTSLAPNTLVLDDTSFSGTITGFGAHDILIDAAATYNAADHFTFSNGAGTLIGAGGVVLETFSHFTLASGPTSGVLPVADSSGGNPELVFCFYAGVQLATPDGEVAVETLRDGDMLLTADGTAHPVVWVGQSHISTRFADPLRFLPIRVTAGALGDGLPVRDLLVSPCHALYLDGILVQAGALVNGTTILRETEVPETFTYYHVELAHHALLIADGALAESFVDNVDRMNFHNWADRTAPVEPIGEMDLPRAKAARQVPQFIRRRLAEREQRRIA